MQGFIVTACCAVDDVILCLVDTIEEAEFFREGVVGHLRRNPDWIRDQYGELSRDQPDKQCVSDVCNLRIFHVGGAKVRLLSMIHHEDIFVDETDGTSPASVAHEAHHGP